MRFLNEKTAAKPRFIIHCIMCESNVDLINQITKPGKSRSWKIGWLSNINTSFVFKKLNLIATQLSVVSVLIATSSNFWSKMYVTFCL